MRKIAIVTGASSGIGREISIELASRSYDLVVVARRRDLLEKLKYDLEDKYKINVYSLAHDLSNTEEINRLVEEIKMLDLNINVLPTSSPPYRAEAPFRAGMSRNIYNLFML